MADNNQEIQDRWIPVMGSNFHNFEGPAWRAALIIKEELAALPPEKRAEVSRIVAGGAEGGLEVKQSFLMELFQQGKLEPKLSSDELIGTFQIRSGMADDIRRGK